MLFEKLKLKYRANKYKNKDDKGGIRYILDSVKEGHTVLDIGAHKGGYLYFLRMRAGDTGKIFAFEPQKILHDYLKRMISLFRWSNVHLEHLALSDSKGTTTLYIPLNKNRKTSPGAYLQERPERIDYSFTEEVKTETLDNYAKSKNIRPDFLKIDVEGNELRIFRTGVETLKQFKPKILVEIEARHIGKEKALETIKFLEGLGYKGYFIRELEKIPVEQFSFGQHQNPGQKPYCNNFVFE